MDRLKLAAGKTRLALDWARANKRKTLYLTAVAAGLAAHYVPGLPRDTIVNAVAVLIGA